MARSQLSAQLRKSALCCRSGHDALLSFCVSFPAALPAGKEAQGTAVKGLGAKDDVALTFAAIAREPKSTLAQRAAFRVRYRQQAQKERVIRGPGAGRGQSPLGWTRVLARSALSRPARSASSSGWHRLATRSCLLATNVWGQFLFLDSLHTQQHIHTC